MDKEQSFKLDICRMCKGMRLKRAISLGETPPANSFLKKNQLNKDEPKFPLQVKHCPNCSQLQLSHVVSPSLLFRDYVYVSSTSPVFIKHFEDYAKDVFERYNLKKKEFVMDIGSNDGILLKPFKILGAKVLGIDPARKIAKEATKKGIETIPEFFDQKIARKIVKKYRMAKVITANNVFAHVDDLDELTRAVKICLDKNGVFVIEAPYLVVFLQKNLFDTIYHEHVSYLSVKPLTFLFKRLGMKIIDVYESSSHGGSIRVFAAYDDSSLKVKPSVKRYLEKEEKLGLGNLQTYLDFAKKVEENKKLLKKL